MKDMPNETPHALRLGALARGAARRLRKAARRAAPYCRCLLWEEEEAARVFRTGPPGRLTQGFCVSAGVARADTLRPLEVSRSGMPRGVCMRVASARAGRGARIEARARGLARRARRPRPGAGRWPRRARAGACS